MISKEQIIALQDEFAKTSLVDGSRLYIVDGIDTASSAAQNSLLKFIEEPINKTPITGVFIARDISNVVPTILSRCNLIHFKAVDILDNIKTLESEGLDTLDVRLSLSYINNLNSARELIKSEFFIKNKEYFLEFIDIKTVKNMTIFNIEKQSFYSDIKNLEVLLCFLGVFYKDVSTFKNDSDDLLLKCLYDKIKVYKIDKLLEKRELLLSLNSKLKSNVSPKNVFFEACMKLL